MPVAARATVPARAWARGRRSGRRVGSRRGVSPCARRLCRGRARGWRAPRGWVRRGRRTRTGRGAVAGGLSVAGGLLAVTRLLTGRLAVTGLRRARTPWRCAGARGRSPSGRRLRPPRLLIARLRTEQWEADGRGRDDEGSRSHVAEPAVRVAERGHEESDEEAEPELEHADQRAEHGLPVPAGLSVLVDDPQPEDVLAEGRTRGALQQPRHHEVVHEHDQGAGGLKALGGVRGVAELDARVAVVRRPEGLAEVVRDVGERRRSAAGEDAENDQCRDEVDDPGADAPTHHVRGVVRCSGRSVGHLEIMPV